MDMDIIHRSCCGLDVHKKSVTACVRRLDGHGKLHKHLRHFGTMTADLLELAEWLAGHGVTHVAMESTGVYWKPIWNLLEGQFTLILVNAQHLKHVPGRKTDVKDAEWIAQLLQVGLLRGSFVPDRPHRELRDLTRHRVQCVGDKTKIANRIHKVLEDANIKLSSVASDVLGVSGRAMIDAIIAGETDPKKLADLALQQLRGKIPTLERALHGGVTDHHRFMLKTLRDQLHAVEGTIECLSQRIEEVMAAHDRSRAERDEDTLPFAEAVALLVTIPGIRTVAAHSILAEIGIDMARFPTAANLCSWCGISAGNNQSAGKSKSAKAAKGNRWLKRTLVQAAHSAGRTKDTYFRAQYRRIAARRGKKRAAIAVAHTMLEAVYHMLKRRQAYSDLGADHFDRLDPQRLAKYLVKRLESLGHKVSLEPAA